MFRIIFLIGLMLTHLVSFAAQTPQTQTTTDTLKKKLATVLPNVSIQSIEPSPIQGLYEVIVDGTEVLYITENGRYVMVGDILDLENKQNNLTELVRAKVRLLWIHQIDPKTFITFKAQNTEKHHLYVFTDVDCIFCRKLHNEEVPKLNKQGVTVHYLAFPRAGLDSETGKKMISVWCADEPQKALSLAKLGQPVSAKTCVNPIGKHLELVHTLKLNGTPALVLDDGSFIPGYKEADKLLTHFK